MSVIPCYKGGHSCSWPACSLDCDGRPGKEPNMKSIDQSTISTLLKVVDQGLTSGLGQPIPGHMCVEAAVCYSLGLDHSDDPLCVAPSLQSLKIRINDATWSSKLTRAKGLRRLAVAQLGTKDTLNEKEFAKRVVIMLVKTTLADMIKDKELKNRCRSVKTIKEARDTAIAVKQYTAVYAATYAAAGAARYATYAVYAVRNAANYAYADRNSSIARDKVLSDFCENVVQILIEMKTPGCEYLYLTEV